jgi:hypothetical protein
MKTLLNNVTSCQDAHKIELGYYPHFFVLLPFPYQDPHSMEFTRKYGDFSLSFTSRYGVPSGKAPRSLISLITTKYVLQHNDIMDAEKRRVIVLGNVTDAARQMGYASVRGGVRGSGSKINKALEQMLVIMLDTASVKVIGQYKCLRGKNIRLFDDYEVWWNIAQKSEKPQNSESFVRISPEFEEIILNHAVPVDINVYNSLSAREQDLYAWAVRRVFAINKGKRQDVQIPYDLILPQFFDKIDRAHKTRLKNELRTSLVGIKKIYPELNIESDDKGLILRPSRLHIEQDATGYV